MKHFDAFQTAANGIAHLIPLGLIISLTRQRGGFCYQRLKSLFYNCKRCFLFKEDGGVCSNGHGRFGDRKTTLMRSGLLYLSDLPHRPISRNNTATFF